MLMVEKDGYVHSELTPFRIRRDSHDKKKLLRAFEHHNVFSCKNSSLVLQNITTKEMAPEDVQNYILSAEKLGQQQLLLICFF